METCEWMIRIIFECTKLHHTSTITLSQRLSCKEPSLGNAVLKRGKKVHVCTCFRLSSAFVANCPNQLRRSLGMRLVGLRILTCEQSMNLNHISCFQACPQFLTFVVNSGVARIWGVVGPTRGMGARELWDYWHFFLHIYRKHIWVDTSLPGPLAVFAWLFCVHTWLDLHWVVQVADTARFRSV